MPSSIGGFRITGGTMKTCTVDDCDNTGAIRRGWCVTHYQRWRKTGDPNANPRYTHQCKTCGSAYETSHAKPSFCAQPCRTRWQDEHNPNRCSTTGCDKGVRSIGLCHLHHKQVKRSSGIPGYNEPWNERRKANSQQRRAQKLGAQTEKVKSQTVYERDAWTCGLCSTPVDQNLSHPHPMSASLDHVLPLSKGGTHTYTNVQLAHLTCNVSKGARVAA